MGTDRRRQVERASQEWRSALIDVSGNNRLLFFRATAGTVDLADAEPEAVADLLAGTTVRMSRLFPDPARLATVQRAARLLAAKQREAQEEYGVSIAFAAFGLATWMRSADDAIARSEAVAADATTGEPVATAPATPARPKPPKGPPPPSAPVLLRGLELTHRVASDAWELTLAGDVQLNPVLVHVLQSQGAVIDENACLEAGADTGGGREPVYDAVRVACAEVPGFAIEDRSLLGTFTYLKQPMVADCEDVEALMTSDLVAALAGDDEAIARVRTLVGEVAEHDPDYKPVDCEYLVLDADASQSFVVNAALAGRNLVVQGPPGTGKSQTIANVIAALVADEKRVLFVAQKRAAITAVLDRLANVGLGEVTLDLFAAGSSRRYVADQLREVLDRQATIGAPVTGTLHQALTASRDRLVAHRDALHVRTRAWGVTVAELLALSRQIPAGAATETRLPSAAFSAWGPLDLDAHAAAVGEYAAKGGLDPQRSTRAGWSPERLVTGDLVAGAKQTLIALRNALPVATDTLDALTREFGGTGPATLAQVRAMLHGLSEAAAVAHAAPGALDPALDDAALERFLAATDTAYRKAQGVRLGWFARRRARKAARPLAPGAQDTAALHQVLLRAKQARALWLAARGAGPVRALAALPAAGAAYAPVADAVERVQPMLQHLTLDTVPLAELPRVLRDLDGDTTVAQLPRLAELESGLLAAGLAPLLTALRRAEGTGDGVGRDAAAAADRLRHVVVHSALEEALAVDPVLASIDGEELHEASMQFQRCDDEHLKANAARVQRAAGVRLVTTLDALPEQHLVLKKEVTKKRNFLPVRRLFEDAPDVMTAVKPVWAMSPLQVSRLLPAAPCFDVVIFDEASQVKPADAIPALVRAPRAIVAGDSRQLPPTEFFTKVLEDTEDLGPAAGRRGSESAEEALAAAAAAEDVTLGEAVVAVVEAAPPAGSFTRDAESILFAFDRILAGQARRLLWHYRSRDERLIAVSNRFVYDGSLTTFPAADGGDVLRHEVVPYSPGIKGGSNSPDAEVARVVELVVEHAKARPDETLGVIAFGIPHTRRIEAALEAAFAADPELERVLNADEREPFFVKNIERVQGDERDAIVLTVGYGKKENGGLNLFWGPLLRAGGERRLNVAISRARARITLVTSFSADDVAEDAHESAGFALMYRFLRFMASLGTDLSGDGRRFVPLNAFEIEVGDRLRAAGLDLVPQLGVGSYRLDYGVRHPNHPGRFVLAIEADGAAYHSGQIARERDRLRQRLLEKRGWRFHRIWSTDWFADADAEVARAVAAYEAAVAESDEAALAFAVASSPAGDVPAEPEWHIAEARRTVRRPALRPGQSIDKYDFDKLVTLVRHVRSDGVLRTRDDELTVLMRELGFRNRGSRIVATLSAAQDAADR